MTANVFPAPSDNAHTSPVFSQLGAGVTTGSFGLVRGSYLLSFEAADVQNPGVITLYGGLSATTVKLTTNVPGYVPFIVGDLEVAANYTINATLGANRVSISRLFLNRSGG